MLRVFMSCDESQVEMERIARQNLEAELQRTLEKLGSATALCGTLQQTELVCHLFDTKVQWSSVYFCRS